MSESWIESEIKNALNEGYRPAPWLLSNAMGAVRRSRRAPQRRSWLAAVAAIVLTLSAIAVFESLHRPQSAPVPRALSSSLLPQPIKQPITRTAPGAQVAWLWMQSQAEQPYLLEIDENGDPIARLDASLNPYGVWRSADGATLYFPSDAGITAYSALNGTRQRFYSRVQGSIVSDAFSSDGRWLALLVLNQGLQLQLTDLASGIQSVVAIPRDPNANLPGITCSQPNCAGTAALGLVVFGSDSSHLYSVTDWGGPTRLSGFRVAGQSVVQIASVVTGAHGESFSTCGAPAMAAKVVDSDKALVAFCHADGAVWFFDLSNMTEPAVIQAKQPNPFWLSPIFTPDGQLLYLHQWPGFGDSMQVIDLAKRKLLGPVATPTDASQNGPFAWLITNVYAGGVASTMPVSPDGLRLYSATTDGVVVMRIPDLKVIAKLGHGFNAGEVWISGDGTTIYATSEDGKTFLTVSADGSKEVKVTLPDLAGGFIASEHG